MGVADQLPEEQPAHRPVLTIVEGSQVFSKNSGIPISQLDFMDSKVIRNMSNGSKTSIELIKPKPELHQAKIEIPPRQQTAIEDVVIDVLGISHRDITQLAQTSLPEIVAIHFVVYEEDRQSTNPETFRSLLATADEHPDADLLRGMHAFYLEVDDRYGVMYHPTIVEPAMTFARWLVASEQIISAKE